MTTPIPHLLLALEGRVDFLVKTNPWGTPEDKPKSKAETARGLKGLFRGLKNKPKAGDLIADEKG